MVFDGILGDVHAPSKMYHHIYAYERVRPIGISVDRCDLDLLNAYRY
jgi:hypothetical protein